MVVEEFITLIKYLLVNFSYLAVFFVGMISTSTIFLPLPFDVAIFFIVGVAFAGRWIIGRIGI